MKKNALEDELLLRVGEPEILLDRVGERGEAHAVDVQPEGRDRGDADDDVALRHEVGVYHARAGGSPEKCQEFRGESVEVGGRRGGMVERDHAAQGGAELVAGGGVLVVQLRGVLAHRAAMSRIGRPSWNRSRSRLHPPHRRRAGVRATSSWARAASRRSDRAHARSNASAGPVSSAGRFAGDRASRRLRASCRRATLRTAPSRNARNPPSRSGSAFSSSPPDRKALDEDVLGRVVGVALVPRQRAARYAFTTGR